MRYAIIGTGAIGGFYGGRLCRAGYEVNFLLHTDYEYVKQNGLQIDSCDGSFHIDNVRAYSSTEEMPEVDVVLVCLKSTREHLLAKLLRKDEVQEKLFQILGEDVYLAILDKVRLGGDLLMWPIDFVRALLP